MRDALAVGVSTGAYGLSLARSARPMALPLDLMLLDVARLYAARLR